MPAPKYTGSPTGEGNPPGKHSEEYLSSTGMGGNFIADASYKHYGVEVGKEAMVTNQPSESMKDVGLHKGGI